MSTKYSWIEQTPKWVWWSFVPVFGGLAISYAGQETKTKSWAIVGLAITLSALLFSQVEGVLSIIWLAQIGTAFSLRDSFLAKKKYPKGLASNNNTELVDVNNCTKHELVHSLGLPIVYANDIESLRNEGHIFTDAEELSELVGVPEATVSRIAPLIVFSYDYRKEADFSWRRLNANSAEELIAFGIDPKVAKKIVAERERGEYKSVMDVKRRTGLPFSAYSQIV